MEFRLLVLQERKNIFLARQRGAVMAFISDRLAIVIDRKHFIKYCIFSIAPAQDNGRIADERLFLIGG